MKKLIIYSLFVFTIVVSIQAQVVTNLNLMPVPEKVKLNEGKFRVDESFSVSINGYSSDRLNSAVTRMVKRLTGRTTLFLKQDFLTPVFKTDSAKMIINVKREGELKINEDESYELDISENGITLKAETDLGAMHGLETLLQLLDADSESYFFPFVNISDKPRFTWRGLMIDVSRHFMPVDVIKRNLDAMAAVKLNVLHWHLTDDQGFRVESMVFPKLQQLGSDGLFYTQDQIKDIVKYAGDRGIRVVPEFDLPGHSTSWFVGYPELASAPGPYKIERGWGVFDPTFNPVIEETYQFFEKFFEEISALFPDAYIHIGGDENNGKQWNANPEIQDFMKAKNIPDNHTLQSYFNRRLAGILTKLNKKIMGWEEIVHPDMPKDIIAQCWRGEKSLTESVKLGMNVILSKGYYIDLNHITEDHYSVDPVPKDNSLTEDEVKRILGGEATMWAEFVWPENIDSRIWPRTAAIAERFWSPATVTDVDDMYRRLRTVDFRMEELGITDIKNYDMMLRRLTNNQDIVSLKTLVDLVEPVKNYQRKKLRDHTAFSPLTRTIDAAKPESMATRKFGKRIDKFLSSPDAENYNGLVNILSVWKNNEVQLAKIIQKAPALKEVEPLSQDLTFCANIAMEAIEIVYENKKASKDWVDSKMQELKDRKVPKAQVELVIIPVIMRLLNSISVQQ